MTEKRLPTLQSWDIIETDRKTGQKRTRKVYATSKAKVLAYVFKTYDDAEPLSPLAKRVKEKLNREREIDC